MLTTINQKVLKTALYCRFSRDDGDIEASTSIKNQKAILQVFLEKNNFILVDYYIDDGFTGLNFNRPDFKRMIGDIEKNRIDLVITKDLSRLGRDYIATGDIIENYFPDKNVRYIAINDNIDTINEDNDIIPFKNILNNMYSKDLSKKIKTVKRHKAMLGHFQSAQCPYGYKKDPANPNHLIIDEEAAKIVREIFKLCLEGRGTIYITKMLTQMKITTPSAYKSRKGDTRFDRFHSLRGEHWEFDWCPAIVRKMLHDVVYVGDMENLKMQVVNYKTKKRKLNPVENRIIVKNTHEPIISREDYEKAQQIINSRVKNTKHEYENVFKSLVFCKECGRRLPIRFQHYKVKNGYNGYAFLACQLHTTHPHLCTHAVYILYSTLKQIVTERVRAFFEIVKDDNRLDAIIASKTQNNNLTIKLESEKLKIEQRLESLVKITMKIYTDNIEGVIDDNLYQRMVKEYQQEQKNLNVRLNEINEVIDKNKDMIDSIKCLKEIVNEYLNFKELTIDMVYKLISKIYVEHPKEENGVKTQEITIVYRFIDMAI